MPDTEQSILSSTRCRRPAEPAIGKKHLDFGAQSPERLRFAGVIVGLGCLAVLVTAWHLYPKGLPLGAQTQLSLPSCALQERTGYPCPTCGMTRAWGQAVRGNLAEAFRANIAGAILAVVCGLGALAGLGVQLFYALLNTLHGLLKVLGLRVKGFQLLLFGHSGSRRRTVRSCVRGS